jgi:hypothetical protein
MSHWRKKRLRRNNLRAPNHGLHPGCSEKLVERRDLLYSVPLLYLFSCALDLIYYLALFTDIKAHICILQISQIQNMSYF